MARGQNAAAQVGEVPAPDEPRKLRPVSVRRKRGASRRSAKLSSRELRVLGELANGHTTEQIGLNMRLSPHTVRTHIKNAMRKLDAHTRAHAVAIALSDRVIKLES